MFNTNRAFLGLLHRSFLTKPALTLIFIASVSLSLASGYTTWDGMTEFTSSAGLSFLMTAGLQGLMLVLAWVIGKELVEDKLHKQSLAALKFKDRTRAEKVQRHFSFFLWRHKGIILSFVLCMAVSVFFSFDSFFRNIFTETQRGLASTVVARTEVQIISGEVETALARASTRARSELIKSPQWTDLKKRLTSLTENTEKIEGLVALSQAEKTRELAGTSAALQSAIRLKTIDLERSKAEEQKLATTQTDDVERVKLRTLIAGLRGQQQEQQKIVDARIAKIEDEIKTGQGKRARGCGPVCRSLKSELVQDEQKLEEIKSKLRQAVNQETEINNLASNVNTAVLAVRS